MNPGRRVNGSDGEGGPAEKLGHVHVRGLLAHPRDASAATLQGFAGRDDSTPSLHNVKAIKTWRLQL
ncbi:hypothetical protein MRX96_039831 [Rhipicephalus microplus]